MLYSPVLQVSWGHLVADPHCVDRFILQVWDTRPRLVRYIYNSSAAERAVVPAPPCTRLQVQVGPRSPTSSRSQWCGVGGAAGGRQQARGAAGLPDDRPGRGHPGQQVAGRAEH